MTTRKKLSALSIEDLVSLYATLALEQDNALLENDGRKVNRLYWKIESVDEELKTRPGDGRHALLALYEHKNPQVQLKAAKATLAIAPTAARAVLENLRNTCRGPQKLEASMTIWALDEGISKPT